MNNLTINLFPKITTKAKEHNNILLHIPHSKTNLPTDFFDNNFKISHAAIEKFNLAITDLYVDELFSSDKFFHISPDYSRVYCDVEKYINPQKEPMAKYGMGVIYTHDNFGNNFFYPSKAYKKSIIKKYYLPYHKKLTTIVDFLSEDKNTIIIDCHSFSRDIILDPEKKQNLPDICIGVDITDKKSFFLAIFLQRFFELRGYTTYLNYPYEGSIMPNNPKNPNNIISVMLEINKETYLTGTEKNNGFYKLKQQLRFILEYIKHINLNDLTKEKNI